MDHVLLAVMVVGWFEFRRHGRSGLTALFSPMEVLAAPAATMVRVRAGGIYLYCRSFYGATNGLLSAPGANGVRGGGGGGRIAVSRIFDLSTGMISNTVAGGTGPVTGDGAIGTVVWVQRPPAGTLFSGR